MKKLILIILSLLTINLKAQEIPTSKTLDNHIALIDYWNTVSPSKEEKFSKYIEYKYSLVQNFTTWKKENKFLYIKEFWYYAESFYIKRGANPKGITMDESQIDISRFESQRKPNEEVTINIDGFKDVIVLLPSNKLIYNPY